MQSIQGLTVYRLCVRLCQHCRRRLNVLSRWRDRGKDSQQSIAPPPPYQQEDASWPGTEPKVTITPASPRDARGRKARHLHVHSPNSSVSRRKRRQRPHGQGLSPPAGQQAFFAPSQPEFQFGMQPDPQDDDPDEQIDALGSRMAYLIEQGRKALGAEVVVQSDVQEDLVDDGTGAWVDDDDEPSTSKQRRRSGSRSLGRAHNRSGHSSPRDNQFAFTPALPMTIPPPPFASNTAASSSFRPHNALTGPSSVATNGFSATPSPSTSFKEDPSVWGSDAIRESMERARARAREAKGNFGG